MKTNRWQRAQEARDGRGIGRWPVVVTNEAETASRITQMMAVPKGNGHDRWQEVGEGEPSWAARWRFRCFTHWTCIKFVHSIAYVVERQTRRLPVRIPERKTGKGERRRVREEGVAVFNFCSMLALREAVCIRNTYQNLN